jgi:hypothetical protein
MLWASFVISPLILGIGLATARPVSRMAWLLLIAGIACVELVFLGKPSGSWKMSQVASLWFFAIVLPWGVVAAFGAFTPYYQHKLVGTLGVPLAYFAVLAIGLLVGDSLGVIPQ